MKAIAIGKTLIERDIEAATDAAFSAFYGSFAELPKSIRLFDFQDFRLLLQEPSRDTLLFICLEDLKLFTSFDPLSSPATLRPFLRGSIRAAWKIWQREKNPRLDFDQGDTFYRRPWNEDGPFAHQTAVIGAHSCTDATSLLQKDLILFAFGRTEESLPKTEYIYNHSSAAGDAYHQFIQNLALPNWTSTEKTHHTTNTRIFSLSNHPQPAWLSYEQWLRKLTGSKQYDFITQEITHPLRIDGPAGSGKTLSLVLKCLHTLKEAKSRQKPHHAAFVVFSEETRNRVLESFFLPLDSEGFHTNTRETSSQSVTITTLLGWSRNDLKEIADPYELSHDDPAVARKEQSEIIGDLLIQRFGPLATKMAPTLSPELRSLLGKPTSIIEAMLQHEFGVVIKGMADGDLLRYLEIQRPSIGLPCRKEQDRRFVYTLFEIYQKTLEEYGIVDLDDVAISHIKLLQMPLRRRTREKRAFDSVFIDEAHSFNPNELGVFFLLTRQAELPPLVIAVDVPQGVGDKGYDGTGIEEHVLHEVDPHLRGSVQRFIFDESFRCSAGILALASSIFTQGQSFFKPIRVPEALKASKRDRSEARPYAYRFLSRREMMNSVLSVADELTNRLSCHRSDVLIVLLNDELFGEIPDRLAACSKTLQKRLDPEQERVAQKANHFVIAQPDYLHGLEFEGVIIVGVTAGEFPPIKETDQGGGASAVFATQQAVDLLYLSMTRARQQVALLYDRDHSFLIKRPFEEGVLENKGNFIVR